MSQALPPESERAHRPPDANERRAALGLLWRAAAAQPGSLWPAVLWLALAAALEALGPLLGKAFIDRHLLPHLAQPLAAGQANLLAMAGLLGAALISGWLASALRFWQLLRLAGLAMRSVQHIRERVYGHELRLPMAFFDRAITGQLVSRVTNDTEAIKQLYVQLLFVVLDSLILLASMLVAMAWLDWRLMLIVATLVPAVVAIVWLYQRWSAPAVAASRAHRSHINAQTAEAIGGMAVLQASGATPRFGQRFGRQP